MIAKRNFNFTHSLFILLGGFILLFLIAPLAGMFLSVKAPDLFATIEDREVSESIFRTLAISALATAAASIFALPLSYILARKKFPLKWLLEAIIDLPVMIP